MTNQAIYNVLRKQAKLVDVFNFVMAEPKTKNGLKWSLTFHRRDILKIRMTAYVPIIPPPVLAKIWIIGPHTDFMVSRT